MTEESASFLFSIAGIVLALGFVALMGSTIWAQVNNEVREQKAKKQFPEKLSLVKRLVENIRELTQHDLLSLKIRNSVESMLTGNLIPDFENLSLSWQSKILVLDERELYFKLIIAIMRTDIALVKEIASANTSQS